MDTPRIFEIASGHPTPFYLYDMRLLERTLKAATQAMAVNPKFRLHYAMKACAEEPVLKAVRNAGVGLDTVSGGEIAAGIKAGFSPDSIMFAGVGKTDSEIDFALTEQIKCFNVESLPELEAISERAVALGKTARVALRINPDIDAHTHHYITTGLSENKFGISLRQLDTAVDMVGRLEGLEFFGLHFHIGSQITVTEPFKLLCQKANYIVNYLECKGLNIHSINMGGGLAIDYDNPQSNPVPDFKTYFETFNRYLDTEKVDEVHFEPGRALVGQCGSLISRVVFVKEGETRTFVIADAGMTELIRPALYEARHPIVNISGNLRGDSLRKVDIVGPVCESSDVFGQDYLISLPKRGDILSIGCVGAYGQSMSSHYNGRSLNPSVFVYLPEIMR